MATRTVQVNPFIADTKTEAWLDSFGVRWDGPVDIAIDGFNMKDSRKNQARSTALVPEAVETYVIAMNNGDKFPAAVVYPTANGYVFVDGVNRHAAATKHEATHMKCYVIEPGTASELLIAMTTSANTRNGAAVDKGWRVIQAEHLFSSLGFTLERACQLLSVRPNDVKSYQKLLAADDNADRCGIARKLWDTISVTSKVELNSIGNLVVFDAAVRAVIAYGVAAGAPIKDFVRGIRDNLRLSEADALAYIAEFSRIAENQNNIAKAQGKKRSTAPQIGLITGVGKILHTDPEKFNRSFITEEDRRTADERLVLAMRHLAKLRAELNGRKVVVNDLLSLAEDIDEG